MDVSIIDYAAAGAPAGVATRDVRQALAESGAVLFRGPGCSRAGFIALTDRHSSRASGDPTKALDHRWRHPHPALDWALRKTSRVLDRMMRDGGTRWAPDGWMGINPHNENTFLPAACPDVIWLHCQVPAASGGASILCDGSEVLAVLPESVREYFSTHSVSWRLSLSEPEWRAVYGVDRVADLEQQLADADSLTYALDRAGALSYRFEAPQVQPTRFTGNPALKTNVLSKHPFGCIEPSENELDDNGEAVPIEVLRALLRATMDCRQELTLRAGDVLLLDNSRVMHGRTPYEGDGRRIATRVTWLRD